VRRPCLIVLVLVLGVALIATLAAPAGGKEANSKVSVGIGFVPGTGNPFFRGTVKSGRKSCKRGRPVDIFFERNRGKKTFFKRDRSDSSGYYEVPMRATMRTGGYFARVKPRSGCKLGKSNPIAVGQTGPGGIG
jgi:hypothetical protein